MRKRIVPDAPRGVPTDAGARWLDLTASTVEVTSEDEAHPVEHALLDGDGDGWRAGATGPQRLSIHFDRAQDIRRIAVTFHERTVERTQEFVLRWSDGTGPLRDVVRQQWNFSPSGSVVESEDYEVELRGAKLLELTIVPDISGKDAYASLASMKLA